MSTSTKPRILIARDLTDGAMANLDGETRVEWIRTGLSAGCPRSTLLGLLKQHAPVFALVVTGTEKVDDEVLDAAGSSLLIVSTMSVGYDHISTPALSKRRVKLGNTPDVLTDAVAETAVGLVLAACRRFREAEGELRRGMWGEWAPKYMMGMGLTGKNVGIVGLGGCGIEVAKRLVPFKVARILYNGPRPHPDKESLLTPPSGVHFHSSLTTMLPITDILIITCALTPSTRGLLTYPLLKLLPRGSVVVNVARGGIIVQDDLVKVVREGQLAGVGLDVMSPEPIPVDDELLGLEGVTLLPHIGSATREAREAMAAMALGNAVRGVLGVPLLAEVVL